MTTFYYVAVSGSAKHKIAGKIQAESEKEARAELNKMSLAILSIGTEKVPDWNDYDAFEFEANDKTGKKVLGEIDAENVEQAYDRLTSDLNLKVSYVCKASATEAEKAEARKNGVKAILAAKEKVVEEKEEAEKRTITGGLKSLVHLGERDHKNMDEVSNVDKFSNSGEEDLTKRSAADFAEAKKPEADEIKKVALADVGKEKGSAAKEGSAGGESAKAEAAKKEDDDFEEGPAASKVKLGEQLQNLQKKLMGFFPDLTAKASELYFHLTEVIVPPKGKTRADGWQAIKTLLSPPKDIVAVQKEKSSAAMKRKAVLERFWLLVEDLTDALAFLFTAYFAIGMVALRVELGSLSRLAEQTLQNDPTIPFLAFAFILIRILIFLREKFTSWSVMRTSLLFIAGSVALFFVGVNLL